MIILLCLIIIGLCLFQLYVTAKSERFWLLAPSTMMTAYFLLVSFPGLFLASTSDVLLKALAAHVFWFCGVLFAVFFIAIYSGGTNSEVRQPSLISGNTTVFWAFVMLSVPAVLFTFYMLGRVPLFIGLSGSDSGLSMHAARQMNTLQHRSSDVVYFGQGYLREIYTVVSPVFLVALYVFKKRNKIEAGGIGLRVVGGFLILAAALNGQIWIAAHVMLLFFMASYYVEMAQGQGDKQVSVILKGIFAYVFLVGFVFLYRYFQYLQGREFENFFLDTLERIYSSGGVDLFGIFPSREPFRYGATWINDLRGMLPGSIQSFSYEVHYLVHGGAWGFTLSPGIVASSYVNFGFGGVFLVAFAFTLVFNFIFLRLARSMSAIKMAIGIYISHKFTLAMPGDINSYVVCLVSAMLIYFSYVFASSFARQVLFVKSGGVVR